MDPLNSQPSCEAGPQRRARGAARGALEPSAPQAAGLRMDHVFYRHLGHMATPVSRENGQRPPALAGRLPGLALPAAPLRTRVRLGTAFRPGRLLEVKEVCEAPCL